jgi:cellulose synthase operon protein YhjQ
MGQRSSDPQQHTARPPQTEPTTSSTPATGGQWPPTAGDRSLPLGPVQDSDREDSGNPPAVKPLLPRPTMPSRITPPTPTTRPVSPFSQALVPSDSTRGRRAQDDFDYQQSQGFPDRRNAPESVPEPSPLSTQRSAHPSDPAGPAWLYAPSSSQVTPKPIVPQPSPIQSSVADTLQHSRERVAARWFALKGVFEQPGQEQPEATPVRQKETRTPVLAVFSLAGGVGKTSLIATVGRALSSMGEKVLLTDTTSHGLLPFYFGASELRQGTVRTFSPPSGSTDAPIYLVSYEIDQKGSDEAAQEQLAEEIINNSRGTHRILLDLNVQSSWIVRRLSRLNPTILIPVAPDMNSVISLQTVEKFFSGVNDGDGRPLQPFYVLNQFDTSLPLHLDVREVMRRQLGDRLLPFVIRRAPAVSEALAEGMTVVDYAPDAPVAEDYLNLATWLRTVAAPATAGFRNVRWSER